MAVIGPIVSMNPVSQSTRVSSEGSESSESSESNQFIDIYINATKPFTCNSESEYIAKLKMEQSKHQNNQNNQNNKNCIFFGSPPHTTFVLREKTNTTGKIQCFMDFHFYNVNYGWGLNDGITWCNNIIFGKKAIRMNISDQYQKQIYVHRIKTIKDYKVIKMIKYPEDPTQNSMIQIRLVKEQTGLHRQYIEINKASVFKKITNVSIQLDIQTEGSSVLMSDRNGSQWQHINNAYLIL